ncbi:hypothetical protein FDP41_000332 [Naegleria fowleri]|uniref:Uncharacterized protein n=1 Tax=Naegleria fowleri TaxID=5763 RepID=A0A6A5C1Z0_NAEFO|nr:uncharacterized protein FDP41_000332 [Naegleria fowleri]KAF0984433.1 hypothetical protein FDP41_000332 [Naegleria fowleri]CAG4708527.1 unnamed protein product [Naegleria fowleri]
MNSQQEQQIHEEEKRQATTNDHNTSSEKSRENSNESEKNVNSSKSKLPSSSSSSPASVANYTHFEQLSPIQRIQVFIWEIFNIVKNLNLLKQWIHYSLGIPNNINGQNRLETPRQKGAPALEHHLLDSYKKLDHNSK